MRDCEKGPFKVMNLKNARTIVDVGIVKARELGVKVAIAILDAGGHLILIERMDDAGFLSPEIAYGKAFASVAFKRRSAEIQTLSETKPTFFSGVTTMTQGRFLPGMGALPILQEDLCLGAIGVSGAKAAQDQEIAEACIQALSLSSE